MTESLKPSVSFVLPAFNEGQNIEKSLRRLDSTFKRGVFFHKVVVVDDGSVDDTAPRTLRYAEKNDHVRLIGYNRNVGKGFAIKTGFFEAVGDIVVFLDSDLDIDIKQIKRYIEALKFADIVVGSKYCSASVVESPFFRRLLSRTFNALTKLLTGIKVSDTQVGIKAIRRGAFVKVFRRLRVKRYAFDVELLVLANIYGLKVVESPVSLKVNGRFKFIEVWRMALDLLRIFRRLRIGNSYH